jgi:glycosyltransferase involved in cell wall biosynthesis
MHGSLAGDTNETLPFVSVILPVYNDAVALRRCLLSLRAQTFPAHRFEVIIVDNASTKDDPKAVVAEFTDYRFCIETKIGSYAARNKGISLANGEIYAFLDSDCIASPEWLEEGVRALVENPDCGLIGGRIDTFYQIPKHPTSVELYERVTTFQCKKWIEQYHVCVTANLFAWAKVFDTVGPFNETLKSAGDFDWSGRVHTAGLELIYNDNAYVSHPMRRTWRQVIKRKKRIVGGRVGLEIQRKDTIRLTRLFYKIYRIFVPRIYKLRECCSDERLKNRSERFRVATVFVVLHYIEVWERLRLILGFNVSRS